MDDSEVVETLWAARRAGRHYPAELAGRLDLEQGLRAQLGVLERLLAAGEKQAGWKIAVTSALARKAVGLEGLLFGYLLEAGDFGDPGRLPFQAQTPPLIEVEVCVTLAAPLEGPGVTAQQAAAAVGALAPAFEILERRGDLFADVPLGVADNLLNQGFVRTEDRPPAAPEGGLERMGVQVWRNGEPFATVNGWGEAMDNQFESLAWLANRLAAFGRRLEPGERIMSGSYIPPTPVAQGDAWRAEFAGLGTVAVAFN